MDIQQISKSDLESSQIRHLSSLGEEGHTSRTFTGFVAIPVPSVNSTKIHNEYRCCSRSARRHIPTFAHQWCDIPSCRIWYASGMHLQCRILSDTSPDSAC